MTVAMYDLLERINSPERDHKEEINQKIEQTIVKFKEDIRQYKIKHGMTTSDVEEVMGLRSKLLERILAKNAQPTAEILLRAHYCLGLEVFL